MCDAKFCEKCPCSYQNYIALIKQRDMAQPRQGFGSGFWPKKTGSVAVQGSVPGKKGDC